MKRAIWFTVAVLNISVTALMFTLGVVTDFHYFYSAGTYARTGRIFPYAHLPIETAIWAPLSMIPFEKSFLLWKVISCVLVISCAYLLAKMIRLDFLTTALQCAAFFPVIYCICMGQDSVLELFLLTTSLYLLTTKRPMLAGLILSMALFKPQVPLVIAFALFASGRRKALAGFLIGGASTLLLSILVFGNWVPIWIKLATGDEVYEYATKMISIRGLVSLLSPVFAAQITIVMSLALLAFFGIKWRKVRNDSVLFSSAVLVGSLVAFHFHPHETSLFLIPLAILPLSRKDVVAAIPFFCAPAFMLLMVPPITCLLALSSTLWLRSYLMINISENGDEALKTSDQPARAFPTTYTPTAQTRC